MIQEHLHEDRVRTELLALPVMSAVTGKTGRIAMNGDMIGRGHHEAERVIQTEIKKDTSRLVETEAEVDRLISEHLRIEMLSSKDFPSIGHRKTLAAPFLPSCGSSNPTHFHPKCYLSMS